MPKARKGCHNCSQRRIKCDLTRPKCNKCIRKGLDCLGYGILYRFNDGVASRGKLTGCVLPVDKQSEARDQHEQPAAPVLLWPDGSITESETPAPQPTDETSAADHTTVPDLDSYSPTVDASPSSVLELSPYFNDFALDAEEDDLLEASDCWPGSSALIVPPPACPSCNSNHAPGLCESVVPSSLETIGPLSRELFAHFSSSVAPVMVVLDGRFNGYRDLILPLACEDDLVKRAVSVVSMYHLAPQRPEMQSYADLGFQTIIQHLRHRTSRLNNLLDIPAWATMIVLLTGETITGGSNLPYLFKILQHLSEANTKSGQDSVMHTFLKEQTRMMTLFAQPLLGESAGTMTLSSRPDAYFDFISNMAIFHPQLATQIDMYKSAIRRACNIYLTRVTRNPPHCETTPELEVLKDLCARIHPSTPGHHTLVWVYFIAAAESSTLAHRDFFTMRLQEVFSRTRFHNIPTALSALQELWKVQAERRWTEILPQVMPVFII